MNNRIGVDVLGITILSCIVCTILGLICWTVLRLFNILHIEFPNQTEVSRPRDVFCSRDMDVSLPELPPIEPEMPEVLKVNRDLMQLLGSVEIPCVRLILGDTHRMFITAYCSAECGGSVTTRSGATCHRSSHENRYEPTTCAIDRRYFNFGDLFYVPSEDRVYVAEDTGSGVRGMWLDVYQNSFGAVQGYNTRYETVYEVEIEHYNVPASNYDIRYIIGDILCGVPDNYIEEV